MELAFATQSLRDLCEQQPLAEQELGIAKARVLIALVADLKAASTVSDLPSYVEVVADDRNGTFRSARCCVSAVVAGQHVPLAADGSVEFCSVYRIKIVKVEDDDDT